MRSVERPALNVVLVEPEIHWNTGNVGRTCLAAGAQLHLVEPLGFSLDDRELKRAGLDYWPRVDPRVWPSWSALEAALPSLGEPFLFSAEAPRTLWDVAFPERAALVFGRESVGLREDVRARFRGRLVRVPMADPALRSLNLSTAVAIALYEVLRQRRPAPRLGGQGHAEDAVDEGHSHGRAGRSGGAGEPPSSGAGG
jgi:tRNA (cytidine/uridine-2'-O-)-methyltransferase